MTKCYTKWIELPLFAALGRGAWVKPSPRAKKKTVHYENKFVYNYKTAFNTLC